MYTISVLYPQSGSSLSLSLSPPTLHILIQHCCLKAVYFKHILWSQQNTRRFLKILLRLSKGRKCVLMREREREKKKRERERKRYSRWTLEERHFSKLQLVLQSGSWNYQTWRVTKATAGGSRQSRCVCVCACECTCLCLSMYVCISQVVGF